MTAIVRTQLTQTDIAEYLHDDVAMSLRQLVLAVCLNEQRSSALCGVPDVHQRTLLSMLVTSLQNVSETAVALSRDLMSGTTEAADTLRLPVNSRQVVVYPYRQDVPMVTFDDQPLSLWTADVATIARNIGDELNAVVISDSQAVLEAIVIEMACVETLANALTSNEYAAA